MSRRDYISVEKIKNEDKHADGCSEAATVGAHLVKHHSLQIFRPYGTAIFRVTFENSIL